MISRVRTYKGLYFLDFDEKKILTDKNLMEIMEIQKHKKRIPDN